MYTVLIKETDEILECPNLQVLYKAIRRRIRWEAEEGGKITAFFYKNIDWMKNGFSGQTPFFKMAS